jgi:hypothetical protein
MINLLIITVLTVCTPLGAFLSNSGSKAPVVKRAERKHTEPISLQN